jgi:FkbM family methyltransferase
MLQTYKECFFDESYQKGFPSKIQKKEMDVVLDIGANVGYFSLFALHKNPKVLVLSYEPVPHNFALMRKYKEENLSRIWHIFNMAVSGTEESIHLNYDPADSFTTDASIFNTYNHKNTIEVKCTTLEKIFSENKLSRVDLLKLDCEGSEYSILYSSADAVLQKISCMAVETHQGTGKDENLPSMENFLKLKGFKTNVIGSKVYGWR